jgi:hypothetical protein
MEQTTDNGCYRDMNKFAKYNQNAIKFYLKASRCNSILMRSFFAELAGRWRAMANSVATRNDPLFQLHSGLAVPLRSFARPTT